MNKRQLYESIMMSVAIQVKKALNESEEKQLSDIDTKWSPRKDLFKEKDPNTIVRSLVRSSKDYGQAMKRLNFYMNRAGKNLENKTVLNKAKLILHAKIEKLNKSTNEGECCDCGSGDIGGVSMPYNTTLNTVGVGDVVPAGKPALTGSDFTDDSQNGSGDRAMGKAKSKKKNNKFFKIATKS